MININNTQIDTDGTISTEIIKSLRMLVTTPMGTVALDRDYGIDMSFLDMPLNRAKQMFSAEITAKTRKYEPRAVLKKIEFTQNPPEGSISPKLTITRV